MSSEVIARLETLLERVVTRRAQPRVVAAVAARPAPAEPPPPVVIEPVVDDAPVVMAAPILITPPVPEAPGPVVIEPVAEEPAKPLTPPIEPTLVSRRDLSVDLGERASSIPSAPESGRADDRVSASFAAGVSVSPGLGDDDADHVETLAFRVGRPLPKPAVPAPPLPVTTRDEPGERRSDPGDRRSERFSPSMPSAPVAAMVAEPTAKPTSTSLRSLLQRSVALRPRG